MPTVETKKMLAAAADACDSKKAEDIRILELDPSESALTDYFLICNGTNDRQNVAIADEVEARLKRDFGTLPNSVEGRRQGEWVLMDYVDFVVHVFLPERREFYGLEKLKKSATRISLDDLNAGLKKKVESVRAKAPAKKSAAKKSAVKSAVKSAAKKAANKAPAKAVAKKAPVKAAAKKSAVKKTALKSAVKKAVVKTSAVKKAAIKKTAKKAARKAAR